MDGKNTTRIEHQTVNYPGTISRRGMPSLTPVPGFAIFYCYRQLAMLWIRRNVENGYPKAALFFANLTGPIPSCIFCGRLIPRLSFAGGERALCRFIIEI